MKSDSKLISENSIKKKLIFLGYSAINLPLLMEVANEALGMNQFLIMQNIPSNESPIIYNSPDFYNYQFIEDPFNSLKSPCFLGVTNVAAKVAVHNYFQQLYPEIKAKYISLIHPQSYISQSASIDKTVLVEPEVIVSAQTKIGFGVSIKRGANIGHHNTIGNFTSINPGCILSGNVTIGEKCTLGTGSVFRDSITVGENTVIGMGSVVTKSIPANSIAYGNPCKVIKTNLK